MSETKSFFQLPESQVTEDDMFADDRSISQNVAEDEMIRQFLAADDGADVVGVDMDVGDDTNTGEVANDARAFPIPRELLVTLPIVEVGANTKIIHINRPDVGKQPHINTDPDNTQNPTPTPARIQPLTTPEPRAGTSGVALTHVAERMMDLQDDLTPANQPPQHQQVPRNQAEERRPVQNNPVQPKKGYNTKNRKTKTQNADDTQDVDPTLQDRMKLRDQT